MARAFLEREEDSKTFLCNCMMTFFDRFGSWEALKGRPARTKISPLCSQRKHCKNYPLALSVLEQTDRDTLIESVMKKTMGVIKFGPAGWFTRRKCFPTRCQFQWVSLTPLDGDELYWTN